jgi:hypothetical protein
MLNVFSQLTAGTRFNKKKNKDVIELFKGKGIDYNNDDDVVEMIMMMNDDGDDDGDDDDDYNDCI